MAEINPVLNPSQNQVAQAQRQATSRASELATSITGVDAANQALIREILPADDLNEGDDSSWTTAERDWVQAGLSQDTTQEVYEVQSNNNAQDKVIVFYGLANVAADVITTEVSFRDGTDATFARFNVETLEITEVSDIILLDQPIVYGATEDGHIHQWPDDDGDGQIIYLAKVAEPLGQTVTTRERPESRLMRSA